jgi:hypothetical protein
MAPAPPKIQSTELAALLGHCAWAVASAPHPPQQYQLLKGKETNLPIDPPYYNRDLPSDRHPALTRMASEAARIK